MAQRSHDLLPLAIAVREDPSVRCPGRQSGAQQFSTRVRGQLVTRLHHAAQRLNVLAQCRRHFLVALSECLDVRRRKFTWSGRDRLGLGQYRREVFEDVEVPLRGTGAFTASAGTAAARE